MRKIALFLLLLAVRVTAAAEPTMPPQFFIERIDVREADRVSPDVVIAESRLRTGRTYSEQDLREASDRVNRLPYLLSADFSLEKGTDRGNYVLVITLNETRVFFFNFDALMFYDSSFPGTTFTTEGDNRITTRADDLSLGWRFFVGQRGAFHFGVQGSGDTTDTIADTSSLAVGYTQYDLFGTNAFVTFNLKRPMQEGMATLVPQLVVGVPLTARQTLTTSYDQLDWTATKQIYGIGSTERLSYEARTAQRSLKATWSYNTTNHPFVPTSGILVNVSPVATWSDYNRAVYRPIEGSPYSYYGPVVELSHSNSLGVYVDGRRYFALTERNSVSAGAQAGWVRSDADVQGHSSRVEDRTFGITGSASHSLWTRERTAKEGDSRIEASLLLQLRENALHGFSTPVSDSSRDSGRVGVAWVRRNGWGTWRLGLGYAW